MPRVKTTNSSHSFPNNPTVGGKSLAKPLPMKHKSSYQLNKHKKEQQQKQMLHGLVISTVPLTGNEYQEEENGGRSNLETMMLSNGAARTKTLPEAISEERDPEMEQARSRDEDDVKDTMDPPHVAERKHTMKNLFGKMHLRKFHKKLHEEEMQGSRSATQQLPSEMSIKRDTHGSSGAVAAATKPLEERVELVAMQDHSTGKPFVRILMSKTAGSTNHGTTPKPNAPPRKQPPQKTKSMQRKIKKTLKAQKPKPSRGATVPSVISIASSAERLLPESHKVSDPLGVIIPSAADAPRRRGVADEKKDQSLSSISRQRFSGAKGLFKRVSKKNAQTIGNDTSTASPVLVPSGYDPPRVTQEEELGQEVVGAKQEQEKRNSKKAMATAVATTTAAAAVYATASTRRLLNLKKKKAKNEASIKKEQKKKKFIRSAASPQVIPKEDTVTANREMPPEEAPICDRVQIMTLLVPSKSVEKEATSDDNVSSIGGSSVSGTDSGESMAFSEATDDIRTVASVNPSQLDHFVNNIFNSLTNHDGDGGHDEEEDEDDDDDDDEDSDDEEDTVTEMARLQNHRGLIMSPNAQRMNLSDDHILSHSSTWASAFGWKTQSLDNDERDLRIVESDSSASSDFYDEEDIPTDYEGFSEDEEDDNSSYEEVRSRDDDNWDVGSMLKLHKNPSDVYDYDDDMSQVLAPKASSSVHHSRKDFTKDSIGNNDPAVEDAISKLRDHAQRLGVRERDLIKAMSNPSHPGQSQQ